MTESFNIPEGFSNCTVRRFPTDEVGSSLVRLAIEEISMKCAETKSQVEIATRELGP